MYWFTKSFRFLRLRYELRSHSMVTESTYGYGYNLRVTGKITHNANIYPAIECMRFLDKIFWCWAVSSERHPVISSFRCVRQFATFTHWTIKRIIRKYELIPGSNSSLWSWTAFTSKLWSDFPGIQNAFDDKHRTSVGKSTEQVQSVQFSSSCSLNWFV